MVFFLFNRPFLSLCNMCFALLALACFFGQGVFGQEAYYGKPLGSFVFSDGTSGDVYVADDKTLKIVNFKHYKDTCDTFLAGPVRPDFSINVAESGDGVMIPIHSVIPIRRKRQINFIPRIPSRDPSHHILDWPFEFGHLRVNKEKEQTSSDIAVLSAIDSQVQGDSIKAIPGIKLNLVTGTTAQAQTKGKESTTATIPIETTTSTTSTTSTNSKKPTSNDAKRSKCEDLIQLVQDTVCAEGGRLVWYWEPPDPSGHKNKSGHIDQLNLRNDDDTKQKNDSKPKRTEKVTDTIAFTRRLKPTVTSSATSTTSVPVIYLSGTTGVTHASEDVYEVFHDQSVNHSSTNERSSFTLEPLANPTVRRRLPQSTRSFRYTPNGFNQFIIAKQPDSLEAELEQLKESYIRGGVRGTNQIRRLQPVAPIIQLGSSRNTTIDPSHTVALGDFHEQLGNTWGPLRGVSHNLVTDYTRPPTIATTTLEDQLEVVAFGFGGSKDTVQVTQPTKTATKATPQPKFRVVADDRASQFGSRQFNPQQAVRISDDGITAETILFGGNGERINTERTTEKPTPRPVFEIVGNRASQFGNGEFRRAPQPVRTTPSDVDEGDVEQFVFGGNGETINTVRTTPEPVARPKYKIVGDRSSQFLDNSPRFATDIPRITDAPFDTVNVEEVPRGHPDFRFVPDRRTQFSEFEPGAPDLFVHNFTQRDRGQQVTEASAVAGNRQENEAPQYRIADDRRSQFQGEFRRAPLIATPRTEAVTIPPRRVQQQQRETENNKEGFGHLFRIVPDRRSQFLIPFDVPLPTDQASNTDFRTAPPPQEVFEPQDVSGFDDSRYDPRFQVASDRKNQFNPRRQPITTKRPDRINFEFGNNIRRTQTDEQTPQPTLPPHDVIGPAGITMVFGGPARPTTPPNRHNGNPILFGGARAPGTPSRPSPSPASRPSGHQSSRPLPPRLGQVDSDGVLRFGLGGGSLNELPPARSGNGNPVVLPTEPPRPRRLPGTIPPDTVLDNNLGLVFAFGGETNLPLHTTTPEPLFRYVPSRESGQWPPVVDTTEEHVMSKTFGSRFDLPYSDGGVVTVSLPQGYGLQDLSWFGVYDHCKNERKGFVNVRSDFSAPTEVILDGLNGWTFGVKSGPITILNCNTLIISNFTFNGDSNVGANFYVGFGTFPDAILQKVKINVAGVPDGSSLPRYEQMDLLLRLPDGWKTFDADWLAILNSDNSVSFAHILIPSAWVPPCDGL